MTVTLPIYWVKTFKTKPSKQVLVGLNWYRNAHHFDQNKFKQEFEQLILNQIDASISIKGPYTIDIQLYYKRANCDASNICPMIEKVFLDALQSANVVENDNVQFHLGTSYSVISQDKDNPRCTITIIPKEQQ
jgi:hypothetical protein